MGAFLRVIQMEKTIEKDEIQKYIDSISGSDLYDADSFVIKIENFDGPLDLLWFLIKRAKIDVNEIFVSQITEQYLQSIANIESLDLEKASDFIEVAACLIEIKSKAMLPKLEVQESEEESPEKELIRRLEEYRLYKEASVKMKEQETVGLHFRAPDNNVGKPRLVLNDMNISGLVGALQKLFGKLDSRAKENQLKSIKKDRFTVEDKIAQIMEVFSLNDEVKFEDLFDSDYNKSEIITTFQAMLELLKNQFFTARQDCPFGEIILHRKNNDDK